MATQLLHSITQQNKNILAATGVGAVAAAITLTSGIFPATLLVTTALCGWGAYTTLKNLKERCIKRLDKPLPVTFKERLNLIPSSQGQNDWEHRLFLVTNERDQSETLRKLREQPLNGNTMIGVSGLCSLNMAADRGANSGQELSQLIVLDKSTRIQHFWEALDPIIRSAKDKEDAFDKICEHVSTEGHTYFEGSNAPVENFVEKFARRYLKMLKKEIKNGESWLSSDAKFLKIQKLFAENRVIFKRIDLCDREKMLQLKEAIDRSHCQVDTFYLANIPFSIKREPPEKSIAFAVGVNSLVQPGKTLIVTTRPKCHIKCSWTQFVTRVPENQTILYFLTTPIKLKCPSGIPTTSSSEPILRAN